MLDVSNVLAPLSEKGFGSAAQPQMITRDAIYSPNASVTKEWIANAKHNGQHVGTYHGAFVWYGDRNHAIDCNDSPCNGTVAQGILNSRIYLDFASTLTLHLTLTLMLILEDVGMSQICS